MKISRLILFFAFVLSFSLFSVQSVFAASQNENFETISASDLRDQVVAAKGKVILVNFFASWCPPCAMEMPDIIAVQEKYGKEKLVVIGISLDENIKDLKKFVQQTKINFPVYLAGNDIPKTYRLNAIPRNTVYDTKGTQLYNAEGMIEQKELEELINTALSNF